MHRLQGDEVYFKKQKLSVLVEKFCTQFCAFLDSQTDSKMVAFVCEQARPWIGIFRASGKKTLRLAQVLLGLWGETDSIPAKLQTLVLTRELCFYVTNQHYDKILKKAYLTFAEACKMVSWRNYDLVTFMTNGLVELFRVKPEVSYILTFRLVQGLAARIKDLYTQNVRCS